MKLFGTSASAPSYPDLVVTAHRELALRSPKVALSFVPMVLLVALVTGIRPTKLLPVLGGNSSTHCDNGTDHSKDEETFPSILLHASYSKRLSGGIVAATQ